MKKEAVLSRKSAEYSLRNYLTALVTGDWKNVYGSAIHRRLTLFVDDTANLVVFLLCWQSRHNKLLLRVASYVSRVIVTKTRRDKAMGMARFKLVSEACGSELIDPPLRVNSGDVYSATVTDIHPKIKVSIFVGDECNETAVLTNPQSDLKTGDCVAIEVSNTSGGRSSLEVRLSRTLIYRPYDVHMHKHVLVMEIEGVLGYVDMEREGATGLFVPRPDAQDFLQFCSRHFHLATWTRAPGMVLLSKIMSTHPVLFAGTGETWPLEEDIAAAAGCDCTALSARNVVCLVPTTQVVDNIRTIKVPVYNKRVQLQRHQANRSLASNPNCFPVIGITS